MELNSWGSLRVRVHFFLARVRAKKYSDPFIKKYSDPFIIFVVSYL